MTSRGAGAANQSAADGIMVGDADDRRGGGGGWDSAACAAEGRSAGRVRRSQGERGRDAARVTRGLHALGHRPREFLRLHVDETLDERVGGRLHLAAHRGRVETERRAAERVRGELRLEHRGHLRRNGRDGRDGRVTVRKGRCLEMTGSAFTSDTNLRCSYHYFRYSRHLRHP